MRVLVCDDDPAVVEIVSSMLRRRGHEVIVATEPGRIVESAVGGDIDVCTVDLGLGDDGPVGVIEMIRSIKDSASGVRVVVLTGSSDERDRAEALAAGADDFIVKGPGARAVVDRIEG